MFWSDGMFRWKMMIFGFEHSQIDLNDNVWVLKNGIFDHIFIQAGIYVESDRKWLKATKSLNNGLKRSQSSVGLL